MPLIHGGHESKNKDLENSQDEYLKITNIIDMRNETPIKILNIAKRTVSYERIQSLFSSIC